MALIVEDGTGKADAQSLCSVADADSYWLARGGVDWAGLSDADKEVALVKASDYIRNQSRYRWVGGKLTYAQRMPWPRTGAAERDGTSVPETVVPWQVVEATAYLANKVGVGAEDLQPDLARGGGVKSESVGPISTSYFDGAKAETTIQFVDGVLAPLVRNGTDADRAVPAQYLTDIPASFDSGAYEYP